MKVIEGTLDTGKYLLIVYNQSGIMMTTKWNYRSIFGIHILSHTLLFFIYKLLKKAIHLIEHHKLRFLNKKILLNTSSKGYRIVGHHLYLFFDNMFSQISVNVFHSLALSTNTKKTIFKNRSGSTLKYNTKYV